MSIVTDESLALPKSAYSLELWLTCAAHGITPMGTDIDEIVFIKNGQLRDIHPSQKREIKHFCENRMGIVQEVGTECAFREPPAYISDCPSRLHREGIMRTFRFCAPSVVHEHGDLTLNFDESPPEITRVTICFEQEALTQWRKKETECQDGFKDAYLKWLSSRRKGLWSNPFTAEQCQVLWEVILDDQQVRHLGYHPMSVCGAAIRWLDSVRTSWDSDARDILAVTKLLSLKWNEDRRSSSEVVNRALDAMNVKPIPKENERDTLNILIFIVRLLRRVGRPGGAPLRD